MRLSEAIMLGRHLVEKPKAYEIKSCALGMALRASGYGDESDFANGLPYVRAIEQWRWLDAACPEVLPCGCRNYVYMVGGYMYKTDSYLKVLMHLFDFHVMSGCCGYSPWTLEQLVDWARSVEKDSPEGSPTLVPESAAAATEGNSVAVAQEVGE